MPLLAELVILFCSCSLPVQGGTGEGCFLTWWSEDVWGSYNKLVLLLFYCRRNLIESKATQQALEIENKHTIQKIKRVQEKARVQKYVFHKTIKLFLVLRGRKRDWKQRSVWSFYCYSGEPFSHLQVNAPNYFFWHLGLARTPNCQSVEVLSVFHYSSHPTKSKEWVIPL